MWKITSDGEKAAPNNLLIESRYRNINRHWRRLTKEKILSKYVFLTFSIFFSHAFLVQRQLYIFFFLHFLEDWGDTQTLESGYKCSTFPHISTFPQALPLFMRPACSPSPSGDGNIQFSTVYPRKFTNIQFHQPFSISRNLRTLKEPTTHIFSYIFNTCV